MVVHGPGGVRVVEVGPADQALVDALRRRALTDAPAAFDMTLADHDAWTDAHWRSWFESGPTFVAVSEAGEPVGLVAAFRHRQAPAEAVLLISLWVAPERRGTGVADLLAGRVAAWAAEGGRRAVRLFVAADNARARAFYLRLGYRPTGLRYRRRRDGNVNVELQLDL